MTAVAPAKLVRIKLFSEITGYSEKAVRAKIDKGEWREGVHYHKPDGTILIDLEAYYQWARNTQSA